MVWNIAKNHYRINIMRVTGICVGSQGNVREKSGNYFLPTPWWPWKCYRVTKHQLEGHVICKILFRSFVTGMNREQSRYAPSQWETSWHWNDVSHWLGTYLDWSLYQGPVTVYYGNQKHAIRLQRYNPADGNNAWTNFSNPSDLLEPLIPTEMNGTIIGIRAWISNCININGEMQSVICTLTSTAFI